jgi:hypothetical protein
MATTITITNLSASAVYLPELYLTLGPAGQKLTSVGPIDTLTLTNKSSNDVSKWGVIKALEKAGTITVSVAAAPEELASATLATAKESQTVTIRASLSAQTQGTDATVYAVGTLPFKFRVIDAWAVSSAANAGAIVGVFSRAAGAGTRLTGDISCAAAGISRPGANTPVPTAVIAPAAVEGLFVRASGGASALTAEVYLTIRRES